MRPTPLPNLLAAAARNANQGYPDLAMFEVGPGYADPTPGGPGRYRLGHSNRPDRARDWGKTSRPVDA